MSTLQPSAPVGTSQAEVRTNALRVGSRLMLGANVSVQLSFLFAYLYLRASNNNGMWRPMGVDAPPIALAVVSLLLTLAAFAAAWLCASALVRRPERAATGLLGGAVLVSLVCLVVRLIQLTHLGWTPAQGAYVDVSILWFFVIAAEVFVGYLWLLKLAAGQWRGTVPATAMSVRAAAEYWAFLAALAIGVFLLVQFVT